MWAIVFLFWLHKGLVIVLCQRNWMCSVLGSVYVKTCFFFVLPAYCTIMYLWWECFFCYSSLFFLSLNTQISITSILIRSVLFCLGMVALDTGYYFLLQIICDNSMGFWYAPHFQQMSTIYEYISFLHLREIFALQIVVIWIQRKLFRCFVKNKILFAFTREIEVIENSKGQFT